MSSGIVPDLYSQIINDTISMSLVDFQEAAVEEDVLEELKERWQEILDRSVTAVYPWSSNSAVPQPFKELDGFVKTGDGAMDVHGGVPGNPLLTGSKDKQEYELDPPDQAIAALRAATEIQAIGGADKGAVEAVNALLAKANATQVPEKPPSSTASANPLDDKSAVKLEESISQTPSPSRVTLNSGPASQIADGSQEPPRKKRKEIDPNSDLINSDLDSTDDELLGNDNLDDFDEENGTRLEDSSTEVMVCLYDKVQRIKNKWKCVLKDGVLNTGGRDYVFSKATGEFTF